MTGGPLDFDAAGDAPPPARIPAPVPAPAGKPRRGRPPAPGGPDAGARYLWVVGGAALVLILGLVIPPLRHGPERGARGIPGGAVMPPFAVPRALSALDGDATLARRGGEGQAGNRP